MQDKLVVAHAQLLQLEHLLHSNALFQCQPMPHDLKVLPRMPLSARMQDELFVAHSQLLQINASTCSAAK